MIVLAVPYPFSVPSKNVQCHNSQSQGHKSQVLYMNMGRELIQWNVTMTMTMTMPVTITITRPYLMFFFRDCIEHKRAMLCYIVWLYTTMTMTIVNPQKQIAFIQIVGEPRATLRMLPASALSVPGTLSHQLWWAEQTSEWLYPPDKCSPEWLELLSNSKLLSISIYMSQDTCGTFIFVWPAHTTNTDSNTWFWYILFLMMYYDIRSCHDSQLPLASSTMKVLGLRERSLLKALKTG